MREDICLAAPGISISLGKDLRKIPNSEIASDKNVQTECGEVNEIEGSAPTHEVDLCENKINRSCAMVVLFVSEYMNIPAKQLLWPTRSNAATAQARQIAIYILHTMLSISYNDAARYFDRDRTTISHACNLVEDLRDDKKFDGKLERLENLIAIAVTYSGTINSFNGLSKSQELSLRGRVYS